MTPLRCALADYLTLRRALGFKLQRAEKLLGQFLTYVEHRGETKLHLSTMVAWATQSGSDQSGWPAYRLSAVRSFAHHLQAIDPATEVPATDLLPWRYGRATPYLYSDDEVAELLRATAMLRGGHRVATYQTLISLLVATGMRVGEALALDRDDINAPECVLTIRHTKFGKSRELPVHASTIAALKQYLPRGDRPRTARNTTAVLVSRAGTRLRYCNVQWTFHRLVRRAGLTSRSATCRPRIHDLRQHAGSRIMPTRQARKWGPPRAQRHALVEPGIIRDPACCLLCRCRHKVHKMRNILDYLNDRQRPWAQAILRRAYQSADAKTAQRLLLDLARRLETEHPSAAESVREGLDETLTVLTLNLSARLRRSLATTNAAESLLSRTRHVKRNVKRWRSGQMMLRWVAAGVLEAVKGFRRVKGYADMPMLVTALRARDRQLGLGVAQEERQIA